ncbi:MAG: 2,3,4,5-tetrahydropyridine-2,6-dicarboxylate N-acetyltransferase [Streptococcaceae bacterium]|jgi:tetrahydrodipicolinate N-acetyltransferase|nr:2,3,4,5-tetrahydropyridine-2,6-dicarboxylate N-acetyltransferase [Streptococcaceae bacterium]MCH4177237.1 2,3,4,5-tetrahydropyridine-2,6-dicarboxylate N-acetyltransferase [Streptococcaceae bacterium]
MKAEEIIQFIGNAKKQTPVKVYLKGDLANIAFSDSIKTFINGDTGVIFGNWDEISAILEANQAKITEQVIENDGRNSAVPMVDKKQFNARIEPGAIIRDQVEIGNNAVIMMGAIINIGAVIGDGTMIDMGAILGGRATVGKNCHVGAGAVLAGVIEPPSAEPVVIEDGVLIGANAVVVEGVRVGAGAVVAAGAIVLEDVAPNTVVAGSPARVIKNVDAKTKSKTELMDELRKL